jgi:hypothetical protein
VTRGEEETALLEISHERVEGKVESPWHTELKKKRKTQKKHEIDKVTLSLQYGQQGGRGWTQVPVKKNSQVTGVRTSIRSRSSGSSNDDVEETAKVFRFL